jgi:WD40 repeat protein
MVELWDTQRRILYHAFVKSHSVNCTSLVFSTVNHKLLCSVGLDQKMIFYDIPDKRIVNQFEYSAPLTSLSFHCDGHTVGAGTLYGNVIVLDLRNPSEPLMTLKGHGDNPINTIEFIKDKKGKPTTKDTSQLKTQSNESNDSVNKAKWKSIEDIREEAKRNIELRKR